MTTRKSELDKSAICKINKYFALFFAGFIIAAVFAVNSDVLAAGKVNAYGMLTSVEEDGSVIIDGKGYLMSPSAVVQNYKGNHILLNDLLPSRYVHFEFEQTPGGFVILFIKEIPR